MQPTYTSHRGRGVDGGEPSGDPSPLWVTAPNVRRKPAQVRDLVLASDVKNCRTMRTFTSLLALVIASATACTGAIDSMGGPGSGSGAPPPPIDVQIVVQDAFVPQPGVRVLFQAADGSTILEATTDAQGRATADMPDGGNLTVIRTYPTTPPDPARPDQVYTYVGVKPGDRLTLGNPTTTATPTAINVVVPSGAQGTVKVLTACGSGEGQAPNVPMTVAGCPATLDYYVMDSGGSSFLARAAYAPSVDLSQGVLQQALTTTVNATNIPANSAVSVEERLMSGTFELFSTGAKRVDGGPQSVDLPDVQGAEAVTVATIQANNSTEAIATRAAYAATPMLADASTGLIPAVSNTSYAPTGVSWLEQGPGDADFVLATLAVTRGDPTMAPGAAPQYTRVILAPHAGTSLSLPMLVGADAIYNPTVADQIQGAQALVKATGGYDGARATALAVGDLLDSAPMGGSVTMSYAGNTAPTP